MNFCILCNCKLCTKAKKNKKYCL